MAPDDISAPSAGDAAASTTDLPSNAVPAPPSPLAAVAAAAAVAVATTTSESAPPPSHPQSDIIQPQPSPRAAVIATELTNGALPRPVSTESPVPASAATAIFDSLTRATASPAAEVSSDPHTGAPPAQAQETTTVAAPASSEPTTTVAADTPSAAGTVQPQQHLNGDAGSSTSPAMSHGHHGSGMSRPVPGGYGNPAGGYGSPGPHGGGYLYSNATQSPGDAYRASPGAQVSLPSVKSFDPIAQQTQQPPPPQAPLHHHQQHMSPHPPPPPMSLPGSMPHAPAMPNMMQHTYMPMPTNPYVFPSDQGGPPRYPIPPHGVRGPKKEIKRRTKTGCLTCRKRRIKCDEGQPTCNNCKKSKRDCLGYDPIFKSQQGPSNLQPAAHTAHTNHNSKPLVTAPTVPSSIPSSTLPSSNPYGNQPAVLPSSYGPSSGVHSHRPFEHSLGISPPPLPPPPAAHLKPESYDYPQSIDPALHHNLPPLSSSTPVQGHHHTTLPDNSHLRGSQLPSPILTPNPPADTESAAKKMKVEDVIGLLGPMPDVQPVTLTDELFKEIVRVYHEVYAHGLGSFFESDWFHHKDAHGSLTFPNDPSVVSIFSAFLNIVQKTQTNDHPGMVSSGVLEARLIWALATLPFVLCPQATNAGSNAAPHHADGIEARNRVLVIQTLLNGDFLTDNPLSRALNQTQTAGGREFQFWYTLAEYLRYCDEQTPAKAALREAELTRMRQLLDGRENRDLLYSIAIARELAPMFEAGYEHTVPQHHDESNPRDRLFVANSFIRSEAQVTGGTTNVVRRLSEIAIQAFIQPGVNVARIPSA